MATESTTDSATEASRRRARRGGDLTAERILDAAEVLFAERGFAGTTLRDVASQVGVRNPSIYNHFSGKEALYEAVLGRVIGPVLDALGEMVTGGSDTSTGTAAVLDRVMQLLTEHPNLPRLIQHETLSGGERLTPLLRDWIGPVFEQSTEIALRGEAAEHWDAEQIPLLVLAMYQIVVGYFSIAPLYRAVRGDDLLSREMLERQTRLLREIADRLFLNTLNTLSSDRTES